MFKVGDKVRPNPKRLPGQVDPIDWCKTLGISLNTVCTIYSITGAYIHIKTPNGRDWPNWNERNWVPVGTEFRQFLDLIESSVLNNGETTT